MFSKEGKEIVKEKLAITSIKSKQGHTGIMLSHYSSFQEFAHKLITKGWTGKRQIIYGWNGSAWWLKKNIHAWKLYV